MRVLELHSLDGPDGLRMADRAEPADASAVVIEVAAAGVSFPDLLMSRGGYQERPELPTVLGLEAAGVVRSAPAGSRVSAGDRAWASLDRGGFAEVIAAPPERVFPLQEELTFEQGAALPVNFLTAVFALHRRGGLRAADNVLVLGAAGGLGSALVAVAKASGAHVLAVVSTEDKAATARAAGADVVAIGDDWRSAVLEATEGRGADLVADVVGGDATTEAVRATAPEGVVLILGFASGSIPAIPANRLLLRNVSLTGVGLGALLRFVPDLLEQCEAELAGLLDAGLRPVIGSVMPVEDGAEALRLLESRRARGKVILTF